MTNEGDMWDSGKVLSSKQYNVKYHGSKLESSTRYFLESDDLG